MAIAEQIKNSTAVRVYRQGWLSWLGANKAAFDMAQENFTKFTANRENMVNDLILKGEEVEGLAKDQLIKVRSNVEPRVSKVSAKVSEVSEKVTAVSDKVFARKNDVVDAEPETDLAAELAKLSKTVSTLNRKVNALSKPAAKRAPAKKAAKKVEAVKTEESNIELNLNEA